MRVASKRGNHIATQRPRRRELSTSLRYSANVSMVNLFCIFAGTRHHIDGAKFLSPTNRCVAHLIFRNFHFLCVSPPVTFLYDRGEGRVKVEVCVHISKGVMIMTQANSPATTPTEDQVRREKLETAELLAEPSAFISPFLFPLVDHFYKFRCNCVATTTANIFSREAPLGVEVLITWTSASWRIPTATRWWAAGLISATCQ